MVRDDRRREKEVGYGAAVGSKSKEKIMVRARKRTRMDDIESFTAIGSVEPKRRKRRKRRKEEKEEKEVLAEVVESKILVFNSNWF